MSAYKLALAIAAVLALASGTNVNANDNDRGDHDEVRDALRRGELQPLEKILATAKERVPGDVIKIEIENDDGLIVYEIKVLAHNGRVRELELDARTGKVLKIEDD